MKNVLIALSALVSAGLAIFFFSSFQRQEADAGSLNLILAIIFAILAIGLGAFFLFNRVSQHEEIHVTE